MMGARDTTLRNADFPTRRFADAPEWINAIKRRETEPTAPVYHFGSSDVDEEMDPRFKTIPTYEDLFGEDEDEDEEDDQSSVQLYVHKGRMHTADVLDSSGTTRDVEDRDALFGSPAQWREWVRAGRPIPINRWLASRV